jgi:hypothetical protein
MLQLKEFLKQECENTLQLLNETLRHAYSIKDGKRFYVECLTRVNTLKKQIKDVGEKDFDTQGWLSYRLSLLSELITRIERSHIGEFSWPFAEYLKAIAVDICRQEENLPSPEYDPLFFISAEGGLLAYSISFEPLSHDMTHAKNRIFNIVFPRSLKHSVLLHPILGHEIGHAAYSHSNMSQRLDKEVLEPLLAEGLLADATSLKRWMSEVYSVNSPDDAAAEVFDDWKEEYLCDLFGLVIMGPSFVSAHRSLLRTIDPPGYELSSTHPPKLTRYWMIDEAVRYLQWDRFAANARGEFGRAVKSCSSSCKEPLRGMNNAFKVFKVSSIHRAVDGLKAILGPIPNALYQFPALSEIKGMATRICDSSPPVQTTIRKNGISFSLENSVSDFRTVLYAGWLAWHQCSVTKRELSFQVINRFCDTGLLNLQALKRWNDEAVVSGI